MRIFIILIFISFIFQIDAFARIAFWRSQNSRIVIETASQNIFQYNCSNVVTLRHKNAQNINSNVATNFTINLEAVSGITYYSDSGCSIPITSLDISAGNSSVDFYFTSDSIGSPSLVMNSSYGQISQAQTISTNPYIWTGGGADANWSTALNWSGGVAPNSSHTALFRTCASNCSPSIDSNINVAGIRILSDYSGTITQNSTRTITIGSKGFVQYAGTFSASTSSDPINFNGHFNLMGGVFNANSSSLDFSRDFKITSGTFNANSSTVIISTNNRSSNISSSTSLTLNNLTFNTNSSVNSFSGTFIINGTLSGNANVYTNMYGGIIEAKGNVILNNYGFITYSNSSTVFKLTGNTNQTVTSNSVNAAFPTLVIESTGGTILFENTIKIQVNFSYISGNIDPGTSTFIFTADNNNSNINVASSFTFYNLNLEPNASNITISGTIIVNGTLTGKAKTYTNINGGRVEAKGNIVLDNYGLSSYTTATTLFALTGNSNQTITSNSSSASFPNLEISSTGGTIFLVNTFRIYKDFFYNSGNIDAGTSTVVIYSEYNLATWNFANPLNLNNLTIQTNSSTINASGTIIVNNTLRGDAYAYTRINGGTIEAKGDVVLTQFGISYYDVSTALIKLTGTSNQQITSSSANASFPYFEISKPSGNVTISGSLTVTSDTNITSNNNQLADGLSTLLSKTLNLNSTTFTKNAGALIINGVTAGTGSLFSGTVNP